MAVNPVGRTDVKTPMCARILTLRYDPLLDAFDEGPLGDFLKDRRVIGLRDHFFLTEAGPRLVLVLRYEPHEEVEGPGREPGEKKKANSEKWRELLTPADLPLFNTLREWRRERAHRDGVPPYVICTNKQLALLVRARPQSLAKIGEVEGFGKGKIERFGVEMLAFLREEPAQTAQPESGNDE